MARNRAEGSARPADGAEAAAPPAFRSRRALGVFLIVAAAGLAADLLSKHYAFAALLRRSEPVVLIERWLQFKPAMNPGVVFGLLLPMPVVLLATLLAVATVSVIFASSDRRAWGLHAALGMVLAGALGNAYDRVLVVLQLPTEAQAVGGRVRDFIDLYLPPLDYPWPTFNVADVLLVVGVGLIMIHSLRHKPARK